MDESEPGEFTRRLATGGDPMLNKKDLPGGLKDGDLNENDPRAATRRQNQVDDQ